MKEQKKKEPVTKAVTKAPAKKATPSKKQEKKEYPVDSITMTKYVFDDEFVMKRKVHTFNVVSSKDLSKLPEEKSNVMNKTIGDLMDKGYCFSDYEAIEAAHKKIEFILAQGAVDFEYGSTPLCRGCLSLRLRNLANAMRKLRILMRKREQIIHDMDDKEFENGGMPEILPPTSEWDDWDVINGKFQKKPKVETKCLKISDEQKKKLEATLESFEKTNKGKDNK